MTVGSMSRILFLKISWSTITGLPSLASTVNGAESTKNPNILLDNNLKVLDLTDLAAEFPIDITETITPILSTTGKWEFSQRQNPELDPLRYPSVAKKQPWTKTRS